MPNHYYNYYNEQWRSKNFLKVTTTTTKVLNFLSRKSDFRRICRYKYIHVDNST